MMRHSNKRQRTMCQDEDELLRQELLRQERLRKVFLEEEEIYKVLPESYKGYYNKVEQIIYVGNTQITDTLSQEIHERYFRRNELDSDNLTNIPLLLVGIRENDMVLTHTTVLECLINESQIKRVYKLIDKDTFDFAFQNTFDIQTKHDSTIPIVNRKDESEYEMLFRLIRVGSHSLERNEQICEIIEKLVIERNIHDNVLSNMVQKLLDTKIPPYNLTKDGKCLPENNIHKENMKVFYAMFAADKSIRTRVNKLMYERLLKPEQYDEEQKNNEKDMVKLFELTKDDDEEAGGGKSFGSKSCGKNRRKRRKNVKSCGKKRRKSCKRKSVKKC